MRDKIKEREKNKRWREAHPDYGKKWHQAHRHPCETEGCHQLVWKGWKRCVKHAGGIRQKPRDYDPLLVKTLPDEVTFIPLGGGLITLVDIEDYEYAQTYAWRKRKRGNIIYAVATLPRAEGHRTIMLHHLVRDRMGLVGQIDHKDGNGLNNIRSNLRQATSVQNAANKRKFCGISHFKGVTRTSKKNKWRAYIRINYKHIHLGTFLSEEDAAQAYNQAAQIVWGEFARLNDIHRNPVS